MGCSAPDRIRAIAVSADAQRLWLTLQGELPGFAGHEGALDRGQRVRRARSVLARAARVTEADAAAARRTSLLKEFTARDGLGPLFNARSCVDCHPGPGGTSTRDEHFVRRVARMDTVTGRVAPIDHPNSPVARRYPFASSAIRCAGGGAAASGQRGLVAHAAAALCQRAARRDPRHRDRRRRRSSKGDGIKGGRTTSPAPTASSASAAMAGRQNRNARGDGRRRLRQ